MVKSTRKGTKKSESRKKRRLKNKLELEDEDIINFYNILAELPKISDNNRKFVWLQIPNPRKELLKFENPDTGRILTIEVPKYLKADEWIMAGLPNL